METKIIAAFLMGLMSSVHCVGMCGGISVALGMGVGGNTIGKFSRLFAHNAGRIVCYGLLGLLAGAISQVFILAFQPIAVLLRVFSGLMLIAMALYVAQWWMGLTMLEKTGQRLWQKVQPRMSLFMPANRLRNAFVLGLCWGLLPCGLVYSALIWSATSPHATSSMLLMMVFGFGTMPAMLLSGLGGTQLKRYLQMKKVRLFIALLLSILGAWTILQAFVHHH